MLQTQYLTRAFRTLSGKNTPALGPNPNAWVEYTLLATLFALGAVFSSATIIFMKVF